jgi:hypothetical protein
MSSEGQQKVTARHLARTAYRTLHGAARPRRRPTGSSTTPAGREAAHLELPGKLGDDVPPTGGDSALDRPREGIFDGARALGFRWTKRDQLLRTYVDSRRALRT